MPYVYGYKGRPRVIPRSRNIAPTCIAARTPPTAPDEEQTIADGRKKYSSRCDPYGRGWLMELAPADEQYTALPRDTKARGWFAGESERLSNALEHATGVVAADGGDLAVPPHMARTEEQLDALARDFLAAKAV